MGKPDRSRRDLRLLGRRQVVGDERVRGRRLLLRRQPAGGDDPLARRRCSCTRARRSSARASSPTCARATTSRCSREVLDELRRPTASTTRVLFLEADEDQLLTRYKETRRRHPLARNGNVADGMQRERELLAPIRERADTVIDTTGLSASALRRKVASEMLAPTETGKLAVTFCSFGHKHGPARDADLVLDVRFLPNPHWEPELRPLTGFDRRIVEYVGRDGRLKEFYDRVAAAARVPAAAVRRRGQGAPRRGDRLHRRPPPLGRDRRGPRGALPRRRALLRRGRSTATWTARPRERELATLPGPSLPAGKGSHRHASTRRDQRLRPHRPQRLPRRARVAAPTSRSSPSTTSRTTRRSRTCSSTTRSTGPFPGTVEVGDGALHDRRPARSRRSRSATRPRCRGATSASTS